MNRTGKHRPDRPAARLFARAGRGMVLGFTIVELLVAVGAVTLIAIGLSRVFGATGDTVRAGRRVSRLNEYASLLERQMRDDFSRITRDGFIVIRNREATGGVGVDNGVLLSADDRNAQPRRRRVDEIAFFNVGKFTSLRDPVHPQRRASGNAARIYYGHGLRRDPSQLPAYYDLITLDDHNNDPVLTPSFGQPGPNQYAGRWTLLRQVTLLANPLGTSLERLDDPPPPTWIVDSPTGNVADNAIQIGLQPAAFSIFRNVAETGPAVMPGNGELIRDNETIVPPIFACGAVDIAATDLTTIRQTILDAQPLPTVGTQFDPDTDAGQDLGNRFAFQVDPNPASPVGQTDNMKNWMINALPAGAPLFNNEPLDQRMRYEPTPPDLLGTRNSGAGIPRTPKLEFRRTDELMLSASNFVPGCTEFIVEWSFGEVYGDADPVVPSRTGRLIWHGLERRANMNGDNDTATGLPDLTDDVDIVAEPYRNNTANTASPPLDSHSISYRRLDGITAQWPVDWRVIHHPATVNINPGQPLYSCFGYLDPTFPSSTANEPDSVPWAWPRLVRITITLTEPDDPTIEQSFQFILDVPEATDASRY